MLRLVRYMRPHWRGLFGVFGLMGSSTAIALLEPWPLKHVRRQRRREQAPAPLRRRDPARSAGTRRSNGLAAVARHRDRAAVRARDSRRDAHLAAVDNPQ